MPERVPPRRSCPGHPCVSCANWAVLSLTTPANYCYALRRLSFRDLRDQARAPAAAAALYQVVGRTPRAPVALLKPQRIPQRMPVSASNNEVECRCVSEKIQCTFGHPTALPRSDGSAIACGHNGVGHDSCRQLKKEVDAIGISLRSAHTSVRRRPDSLRVPVVGRVPHRFDSISICIGSAASAFAVAFDIRKHVCLSTRALGPARGIRNWA